MKYRDSFLSTLDMQKASLGMELGSFSVPTGVHGVRIIHKTHISALYRHAKHDRDTRLDRVHLRCGGTTHCIIKKQRARRPLEII